MECLNGAIRGKTGPIMYGKEVFTQTWDDVIALLTKNNRTVDDGDTEFSYRFLETSVGLYIDSTPTEVEEVIEEARQEEKCVEYKEWLGEDLDGRKLISYSLEKSTFAKSQANVLFS